jgi:hypothetical protein
MFLKLFSLQFIINYVVFFTYFCYKISYFFKNEFQRNWQNQNGFPKAGRLAAGSVNLLQSLRTRNLPNLRFEKGILTAMWLVAYKYLSRHAHLLHCDTLRRRASLFDCQSRGQGRACLPASYQKAWAAKCSCHESCRHRRHRTPCPLSALLD